MYVQKALFHIVQMYVNLFELVKNCFLILVVIIFWTKLLIYGLQCGTLWPISSGSHRTCSSVWVEGEFLGSKPSNCMCNGPIKKNDLVRYDEILLLIPFCLYHLLCKYLCVIAWIWRVLLRVSTWMSWVLLEIKDIRVKFFPCKENC